MTCQKFIDIFITADNDWCASLVKLDVISHKSMPDICKSGLY